MLKPLKDSFQTCIDEREAEAEEKRQKEKAEADLLARIKNYKEAAATAKSQAKTAADSAKNAETSQAAQEFAEEAKTAATNAENAAASANSTAQDPALTGNSATKAVELVNAAKMDADEAKTFAENAQKAANSKVDIKANINVTETNVDNTNTDHEADSLDENPGPEKNISTIIETDKEDTEGTADNREIASVLNLQSSGYAISSSFVGIVSILMLNFFTN